MWELDHKEDWVPTNWCFWTVVLKTLESPFDSKDIKPVNPKANQPWNFIGRTSAEAEAPILWSPDAKSWLIANDPDTGRDWGQEEKGITEDEMVEKHHQLNGHEFEQTLGDAKDREAWRAAGRWLTKRRIWLSDWTTQQQHVVCDSIPTLSSARWMNQVYVSLFSWNWNFSFVKH